MKAQAEQFDPVELYDTRQNLRPEMEQATVHLIQEKYSYKYSHSTMTDGKRDVSRHLGEYAESQEIRQIKRERGYQQRQNRPQPKKKHRNNWER